MQAGSPRSRCSRCHTLFGEELCPAAHTALRPRAGQILAGPVGAADRSGYADGQLRVTVAEEVRVDGEQLDDAEHFRSDDIGHTAGWFRQGEFGQAGGDLVERETDRRARWSGWGSHMCGIWDSDVCLLVCSSCQG
jgi:hypothetical protein